MKNPTRRASIGAFLGSLFIPRTAVGQRRNATTHDDAALEDIAVNPGQNKTLAIGSFLTAASASIPKTINTVFTSGHSESGKGAATYQQDSKVDAAYVAAHPHSSFINGGRGFRLKNMFRTVEMFGGGQHLRDNGPAINAMIAEGPDRIFNRGSGSRARTRAPPRLS